jgi:hypothetical protein
LCRNILSACDNDSNIEGFADLLILAYLGLIIPDYLFCGYPVELLCGFKDMILAANPGLVEHPFTPPITMGF